jgi:hypothetical protein
MRWSHGAENNLTFGGFMQYDSAPQKQLVMDALLEHPVKMKDRALIDPLVNQLVNGKVVPLAKKVDPPAEPEKKGKKKK